MQARIAALLTCFNRKEKTLACLSRLFSQELPPGVSIHAFLVDDGCTDGTGDAVCADFSQVNVLRGDGTLFWTGGMHVAFGEAMKQGFDYYLWLNDDTFLYADTIKKLLATNDLLGREHKDRSLIGGSVRDPESGRLTYGGLVRGSLWHPLLLSRVPPEDTPKRVLTIEGNCVLVPAAVNNVLGNLSSEYRHNFGDIDYGLRAGRAGFACWIVPGFIGECSNDHPPRSIYRTLTRRERWKKITGPTGHPPGPWAEYCKRYAGPLWPLFWCRPYVKDLIVMFVPGGGVLASKPR